VAAEKNVQIIIFIGPYNGAVVVVALCGAECDYFGEFPVEWIISNDHRFGGGLRPSPDLPPGVENDMDLVIKIDRLRSLPAIIEHLNLTSLPKRHKELATRSWSASCRLCIVDILTGMACVESSLVRAGIFRSSPHPITVNKSKQIKDNKTLLVTTFSQAFRPASVVCMAHPAMFSLNQHIVTFQWFVCKLVLTKVWRVRIIRLLFLLPCINLLPFISRDACNMAASGRDD
jgi:hypothetical protein